MQNRKSVDLKYSEQEKAELNSQLYKWQMIQSNIMEHDKFEMVMDEWGDIGHLFWENVANAKIFSDVDWVVWGSFDKFLGMIQEEVVG